MKKLLLILLCLPFVGFGQKTYVPDDNFEAYLEANGMGDGIAFNDSVLTGNINTITGLDLSFQNISDITGIEDFTALVGLDCYNNQLTSLDLSQNTALTGLGCYNNQLTSLDISQNTALTILSCSNNQLTSLDVSQNTALTILDCQDNQLTSLDVSQNTSIIHLFCQNNQLVSLDLNNHTALTRLRCYSNQLTSLDLTNAMALEQLSCSYNQLTSLNLNNSISLFSISCSNNLLSSLDLSNNIILIGLECQYNQLTSLDLSNLNLQLFNNFSAISNSNLFCIDVDNPTLAQSLLTNIDPWTSFDTNCVTALGCMDSLACNYIPNATIDNGGCTYLPVSLNDNQVICANFSDASLEVIYNTGSYTYQWSNGETTQSIDSLAMGSYSVIVTDTSGCNTTLSANVTLAPAPATSMFPEICFIGVDFATGKNKIYIKPMADTLASRFIIYKESSANIFSLIDTLNYNTLEYLDVSSNPMSQSYRYKISVLDTCGNESAKSNFHKTIHLTLSLGLNGEINLLWNNYEGYQPSDYLIFRSINNGTMNQIGTLPGTNLTYTDLTPPAGILNYQVRALAPQCNIIPFAKNATNMLTSNIINYNTTYIDEYIPNKELHKITDILGRETKGSKNKPLFYIYDDGTVEKRIVIE